MRTKYDADDDDDFCLRAFHFSFQQQQSLMEFQNEFFRGRQKREGKDLEIFLRYEFEIKKLF